MGELVSILRLQMDAFRSLLILAVPTDQLAARERLHRRMNNYFETDQAFPLTFYKKNLKELQV